MTLIAILIRRETRVDASHGDTLDRQTTRHVTELERLNRDHDVELVELNQRVRVLRDELDDVYRQLANERAERLGLACRPVDERRNLEAPRDGR
jgi:hypothetical protein